MEYGGAVAALILVGLWVYTVLDVFGADDLLTRRLGKSEWLKLALFLPLVGGIVWLLVGRPGPSAHPGKPSLQAHSRRLDIEEFAQFVAGLQRASTGSRKTAQSWAKQR
jgi:hypothetical protein